MVSPDGGSPIASPVSSGGRSAAPWVGPTGPAAAPWVIRSAASVQARSSATSSSRESVVTSKAAKCSRSWAGVTIPAWCSPWNGYDVARRAAGAGPCASAYASPTGDARARHPGGGRAAAEQPSPGDLRGPLRRAPPR